ncbi:hypothetical protein [Sinorhizobium glycinis]|nr:hypothetical protein [Sinorhizobium glycinis]
MTSPRAPAGFALKDEIGWQRLCDRAERAVADLPASAVLGTL